jgi:hypothetical protein
MANINQLSSTSTLQGGDLIVVWATDNGDSRKASLTLLTDYLQTALTQPGTLTTQYAAPSATAFSVTISAGDTWLLLTPTGAFAAGTIVLPTSVDDKAEVSINTTQAITALTVSAAATVTGAPTTLAQNAFFTMRYDAVTAAWYRV